MAVDSSWQVDACLLRCVPPPELAHGAFSAVRKVAGSAVWFDACCPEGCAQMLLIRWCPVTVVLLKVMLSDYLGKIHFFKETFTVAVVVIVIVIVGVGVGAAAATKDR